MHCKLISLTAPIVLLLSSSAAFAADKAPAGAPVDLLDTSCGQYLQALTIAKPSDKATPERAAQAVSAQDDIVQALLWVHGYLTGRDGANGPARPLNREWIISNVGKLATICSAGAATRRLADAASQL